MVTDWDESKQETSEGSYNESFQQRVCIIRFTALSDGDLALLFLLADSFSEPSLATALEALTPPPAGMGIIPKKLRADG